MEIRERSRGRQADATAQRTRQRIVHSALALFAARGYDGVSLRDIATHSDVTHGLIRHHFGSKEDIWRAVIDTTFEEYLAMMTPLVEAAVTTNSGALATVKEVSRNAIVLTGSYPEVGRLLMHEGVEPGPRLDYFMARLAPLRTQMDPLIESVQREGMLSQFSHDTFLLALIMLGVMPLAMAAFSDELCNVDILAPEQVEQHADRVIATLFPEIARD